MKTFLLFALGLLALPVVVLAEELQFQPLTSIPAFGQFEASNNLSTFFDSLYKICIGVAAILAVFQIVKSGIIYSLGDTGFFEKREAKSTIMRAVLGLLLVLSPAIVFSAIDERILNLDIGVGTLRQTAEERGNKTPASGDDVTGESEEEANGDTAVSFRFPEGNYFYVIGGDIRPSAGADACYMLKAGYGGKLDRNQCTTLRATASAYLRGLPINEGETVILEVFFDCDGRAAANDVVVRPATNLPLCES